MSMLMLHRDYTREEVHAVFAPETKFTPQAGTWGLHGIIEIPDRPGDFVLFVTFGQEQGGHEFDEGISANGLLRWQSQPRQRLADPTIKRLIAHDETRNSIYLFLRTNARIGNLPTAYTYLGRLKYVTHDADRERPVYFDWQLLDWPIPPEAIERMGLRLERTGTFGTAELNPEPKTNWEAIRLTNSGSPPRQSPRTGVATPQFRGRLGIDYAGREKRNRSLGEAGERLVIAFEKERLTQEGRPDLAEKVRHIALEEGDGAGYDVLSFAPDGSRLYIEVKTTKGPVTAEFFLSPVEVAFSTRHPDSFELRRLYQLDERAGTCRFFSIFGSLEAQLQLTPTEFKVSNLTAPEKGLQEE